MNVLDVSTDDPPTAGYARWRFDDTVTVTASPVTGLRVLIGGVWTDPVAAWQEGDPDSVITAYVTAETLDGKSFEIVTAPSGIAEAARIVLPQSGTVIAP